MEIFLASCFWRLEFSPSRPHLVFLPSRENFSCFPSAGLICEERAVFRFSAHVVQTCCKSVLISHKLRLSALRTAHFEKKKTKKTTPMFTSRRGLKPTCGPSLHPSHVLDALVAESALSEQPGWWDDDDGGEAAKHVPLDALQNTRSRLAQLRIIFHGALC